MKKFYSPILKWKQGEYLALSRLSESVKDRVVPLIEIPKIGYDFESGKDAKTLDEHLKLFPKRYMQHWGTRSAFIDTTLVDAHEKNTLQDGRLSIEYLFDSLAEEQHSLIPVTGLERSPEYQKTVRQILKKRPEMGICIRLNIEHFHDNPDELLDLLEAKPQVCDLVMDLGHPNFSDMENFSLMIVNSLNTLSTNKNWRSATICGTAFPENLASIKKPGGLISRNEWKLYQEILKRISKANLKPNFGDYGISHPNAPEGDMRLFSPAASIRYTTDNHWYIAKGNKVRPNKSDKEKAKAGEKFEGFSQFSGLCKEIAKMDGSFAGAKFSKGDEYILGCSLGTAKTGNLSTWRWVGNNHHITKVVNDLRAKKIFA